MGLVGIMVGQAFFASARPDSSGEPGIDVLESATHMPRVAGTLTSGVPEQHINPNVAKEGLSNGFQAAS